MLEVELKYAVPDLAAVRSRLHRLRARAYGARCERDVYYNAPHRDFAVTDEALRVRYTDGSCTVTYKGPKIRIGGAKAREEFNMQVDSGDVCERILEYTGFRRSAEVIKRREIYELDGAAVALDEVERLGTFVEIEVLTDGDGRGAADRIADIAKKMDIDGPPLYVSYLELLLSTR